MMLQARPAQPVRGLPIILSVLAILTATPFMVGSGLSLQGLRASLDMSLNAKQNLPLIFVPNVGQSESAVSYLAHSAGGTLLFAPTEVVLTAPAGEDGEQPLRADLRMSFLGANQGAQIGGGQTQPGKMNYFVGNNPDAWRTGIETYGDITYTGLYAGIDLHYTGNASQLKGTYTVAPGADASQIRWRYNGARNVSLTDSGDLRIVVAGPEGEVVLTEAAPIAWQNVGEQQVAVDSKYVLAADGTIAFSLGSYDRSLPLIIDPALTYSTYLGGNWAEAGHSIAVDPMGNFYVTGYTNSTTLPTVNPFQGNFGGGGMDGFVAKFDPQGQPVYITYLGGSSSDMGNGIATDADGNAYVHGYTSSQNFPRVNAFQQNFGGGFNDAFVTKLNPTGSALVFSTYLGGNDDDQGADVTVDGTRNVYVTGSTESNNFPVRNPLQPTRQGNSYDFYVTKLNPAGSDLVWSTYLGGTSSDSPSSIVVDATGNTHVTGFTYSGDYPTLNAFQWNLRGTRDAVLSKINAAGSALVYSTYLGGGLDEMGQGVAVDALGNAYIAGYTDSVTFPTVNAYQSFLRGLSDAFVAKFAPTGGTPLYSTYFGGEWLEGAGDIAVNAAGEAFIVGSTQSDELPLANPLYPTLRGSEDVFITRFNAAGNTLIFSTYFGGTDNREMQQGSGAIAVDSANTIYFTGDTGSSDFPTYNPYQPFRGSPVDAFVSRISENSPTPTPTATGSPQPSPTACIVGDYTLTQGTGTLVEGTTYLPNSACDNCTAPIAFPFPITFYDQTFTQGRVGSEGTLQFTSNNALQANFCLPYGGHNNTIFAYWDDLWIDNGVYTAVTGTAPNRVLHIEWEGERSINFEPVQFELRLYENGQQFEIYYADTGLSGESATIGVQRDTGSRFTQFSCDQPLLTPGTKLTFTRGSCLTPTPPGGTPTNTPTPTATPPTLLYSTYFGSFERDIIEDVGRDAAGNIYVMGSTFQNDINYGDIWVAKFSPNGQTKLYETIIGGTRIDYGFALAVDAAGNATVAGWATSNDYPLLNPLQAQNRGGYDVVMTKLNPTGNMIFSTYLGGTGIDYAERLQTDAAGNIYLTGHTDSTNFPTTAGAYMPSNRGRVDGYVTKINPNGSAIIWSTYLGGIYADRAYDLALDATGNVYITGHTVSPDFPTLNPYQPTIADTSGDAFVTKMNAQGTGIIYSTFLGGSFPPGPGEDSGQGITVDAEGHAYVTGFTESPNFPTTAGAFQRFFRGYSDAFVTKFTPAGNDLVYSTFLGGTLNSPYGEDIAYDIAVDGARQAHVTGKTYSRDFPIVNAVQPQPGDVFDAFVTKFNAAGSGLVYSTFLGGRWQPPSFTGNDVGLGILIDGTGNAVVVGGTASFDFPVVNAYQSQSEGPGDGFISKISGSNPAQTPTPGPSGTPTFTPTAIATPTVCGMAQPFVEGFEGGNLGGFVASAVPSNMPGWRATNGASHNGGWSAYSPSTYTAGDQLLTSTNPVTIPGGVSLATMSFWHRYLLEPGSTGQCVDGGVLEISTNGGGSWLDVEPYFLSGGYNGTINGWQNPLGGRRGWCGQSVIFSEVRLNLISFAGQDLLFRFRQGTDTFIAHDGWWIDDVSVSYLGGCFTPTPGPSITATGTSTPVTTIQPTFTAQVTASPPASGTAQPTPPSTGTPTSCSITFSDVPSNHTFYANVMCLACRGIISGYADGTFRPGNDVTRGQLSKIVANAAGFNEAVSGQRFTDVPPTHTFYEFIERMAARNIIGGYSDGTFRPENNATRGQISKIVANAAGLNEPVSGQTFTDVPPTHTFYEFIERMAVRGIISGYADGTFRPQNNATRGQTSKIVANTFFQECNSGR